MHYRLIFIVFLCLFLSSCNVFFFKDALSPILGVEKVEVENSQTLDEWAGVQGDGFILEVYELSEKTVQSFIKQSSKNLPDKKEKNKNWRKYDWSKTPIDSSYNEVFIMSLNYSSNSEKLKVQLNEMRKLIEKEGVYYSFFYRPDKENPQAVQLFILDVQSRKFYAIDQQI
ncbi:MAG: hypothetical protein EOO20_05145 [Chryseobacterium sp.]|nr:MAG: hypothetical protein EOO20_05145 [Chryseobacterium sp.]